MGKKLTQTEVVKNFKKAHGNTYDYSLVEVINTNTKVKIICEYHGVFEQTPKQHIRGTGCNHCGLISRANKRKKGVKNVIDDFNSKHNFKYDYSLMNYVNAMVKVAITCPIHGVFLQTPADHLSGHGCKKCGISSMKEKQSMSFSELIKRFKSIHGDRYDYSYSHYVNTKTKIKIICPIHGEFHQVPEIHLNGCGCPKCKNLSTCKRDDYIKLCQKYDGLSTLYIIHCFDDKESFYKIGITRRNINKRYSSKKDMPYQYREIFTIRGEASFIWDLEKKLHKKLKKYSYTPKKYFKGCISECFSRYIISVGVTNG